MNRTIDIQKSTEFLGASLPCDITLVSLRDLGASPTHSQAEAALLFHRRAFDCDFPSANLQCATDGGVVDLAALFKQYKLNSVKETSLSLMHEKQEVKPLHAIAIQSMDITTFKVVFN